MVKFKLSAQTGISVFVFLILIAFIGYYTVPPLVDFQAHVAMGMAKSPILFQYYDYEPSITYRLLDTVIRFWSFFIGNHFTYVAFASYLSALFLIISTVYAFLILQGCSYKHAFIIISILLGPLFLLLHCLPFIWGLIPYTLAVFMAATSGAALKKIHDEACFLNKLSCETTLLFSLYTFLAFFSHPAGFLYLGIAWIIPLTQMSFARQYGKKRFRFMGILSLILIGLSFFTVLLHPDVYNIPERILHQIKWFFAGEPYNFSNLIPISQEGWFENKLFRRTLTYIPIIVFILLLLQSKKNILTAIHFSVRRKRSSLGSVHLVHDRRRCSLQQNRKLKCAEYKTWNIFLAQQLLLQFIFIIIAVSHFGEMTTLPARHWLFICAWTFMGMAALLNQCKPEIIKKVSYCSPIILAFCLYALTPLYANFRILPIEKETQHYSKVLLQSVNDYRKTHPEITNKTIVIDYAYHHIDSPWDHYHLIPFLLINSPELLNNKIVIREHWYFLNNLSNHQPIQWKRTGLPSNIVYLDWTSETKTQITLKQKSFK